MNSKQIDSELLINEWQLGQQLNTAVHNGTRVKFNLLLSLLSDDAQDFAQFSLREQNEAALAEPSLRTQFHLPATQPLVNIGMSPEQAQIMNSNLHNDGFSSIRLQQLLHNEALLSRQATVEFSVDIIDNLSLLAQQRLAASASNKKMAMTNNESVSTGINNDLMEMYKNFDLENKPLKVTYM